MNLENKEDTIEEEIKDSCQYEDCNCDQEDNSGCNCEGETHQTNKSEKKKKSKKNEIKDLENKLNEAEEKFLLSRAELVNYRKRKDEEVSRMLKFCNEDMVKELLPIIDTFERAIDMDDDNLEDEVSKFLSGFKMIYCNLISILENYGVKAIDGNNKTFDPTYHQAVMTEKKDGIDQGMVLEVLQKGYLLKDKVIRSAMVKVSE